MFLEKEKKEKFVCANVEAVRRVSLVQQSWGGVKRIVERDWEGKEKEKERERRK